ncbi:MAG: SDR family oxidoreductase [Planctomycetaceae bacterium]|jgi:3-oxoacyl-[acyl-carrier protein] reductase|nr:SDR family oxidoreductase [Planctomycetaceae bacterium]
MSSPSPRELANRVAVVTGASRGIGRATAIELAAAGAHVVVHAGHDGRAAERTAEPVRNRGVECRIVVADLTADAAQDALVEDAWQWRDGVDIWINNAGVDILTGDRRRWGFEQRLDALWQVDTRATIRLSRAIGKRMVQRGRGVILNLGWDGAERGMAGDTAELFAVCKGAVMAFTRSLAQSLAPAVRVNCLALGWIKTAWGEQASAYWQDRAREESLADRWGTPEDVARIARFLVSPQADFISGQIIQVNGGHRESPTTPPPQPDHPEQTHSS